MILVLKKKKTINEFIILLMKYIFIKCSFFDNVYLFIPFRVITITNFEVNGLLLLFGFVFILLLKEDKSHSILNINSFY